MPSRDSRDTCNLQLGTILSLILNYYFKYLKSISSLESLKYHVKAGILIQDKPT